ncbi:aminodeoxychorismate synthase component I [Methylonatrum kenyense]|uniref:aminodeoxychorismate synthase component I n=1 Tax=Methylonatrum kenyense TaxID=455253 RepID=UPI0020BDF605|nr:aminodeoxychorismate synthase component I [Methylonatrum kenyense]MCK8516187.1 aminodeoxychorismate synthase component I [Methylonatrum kenyense]
MSAFSYHALPYQPDPVRAFRQLAGLRRLQWLDSGRPAIELGRYDVFVAEPAEVLVASHGEVRLKQRDGQKSVLRGDPFRLLQQRLARWPAQAVRGPFAGGAVGYFGYELGYACQQLARQPRGSAGVPDMVVGLHDWALVLDHAEQRTWLAHLPQAPMTPHRIEALLAVEPPALAGYGLAAVTPEQDRAGYERAFQRVSSYIHDGDCYQVNLARPLRAACSGDPANAYLNLRALSPAAHGACLLLPEAAVLSISPERFLLLRNGDVETRPIKGTRPRGEDEAVDRALVQSLRDSPKDRSENVMIVDLLRNDLGQICETGSVSVPELFRVESHATVHHLVSTVTGRLRADADACDLLRACFPGGSITGAPKRRAMEIIAELEPRERGPYCGAIGYIGLDGAMDTSIAIRTAVWHNGVARYWAGGGLVAESRADEEFQETVDKARAFYALAEGADDVA